MIQGINADSWAARAALGTQFYANKKTCNILELTMEEWNFSIKIWKAFRHHDEDCDLFAESRLLPELKKVLNF